MGDLHLASVAGEEVVGEYAQRQNPELKSMLGAAQYSVAAGTDAAIPRLS